MKTPPKKLTLNQETLRNLTETDLRKIVGGFFAHTGNNCTVTCPTCVCGPCTCPVPKN